ncbi:MAG: IS30 family transposase [bacterium]|nr:IS30 family transposase [bacterium]
MAARLSFDERCMISAMVEVDASAEEIANQLGRCPSTIRRELKQVGGSDCYRADDAQEEADVRARRPKVPKMVTDRHLAEGVGDRLEMGWSPHAISADLRNQDRPLRVSAETIYQACYDPRGGRGLPVGSWKQLPRRRRRRKPRSRCEQAKRNPLGGIRPIGDRPQAASGRTEPGHWEGDLIIGAKHRSAVATLTERVTRHTLLVSLTNGYTAPETAQAVTRAFSRVPQTLRKTLTWDQGREMSDWKTVKTETDMKVYFCDPRSPWQRPSNEHTNGMIRRWLPKSTNLNIGEIPLSIIENHLNLMPRRLHNWQSPYDLYNQLTSNHH